VTEILTLAGSALLAVMMYALFVRPFIDVYQDHQRKRVKAGPSPKELRLAEMRDRAPGRYEAEDAKHDEEVRIWQEQRRA
jgi:hypothetical protein